MGRFVSRRSVSGISLKCAGTRSQSPCANAGRVIGDKKYEM
jgi:hypothetical protein